MRTTRTSTATRWLYKMCIRDSRDIVSQFYDIRTLPLSEDMTEEDLHNFGEGWRMDVGADASAKMLSFFSTLPVALASWWPSLHPLDLLVGLCCCGGLRLAV